MIKSVIIANFKGISRCTIEGLGNINLFIGKNDSCKSTIIETIYSTIREFVEPSLRDVIGRRTNVSFGGRELWYGYHIDHIISSNIGFGDGSARIRMLVEYDRKSQSINSKLRVESRVGRQVMGEVGPVSSYFSTDFTHRSLSQGGIYATVFSESERALFWSYVANSRFIDSSAKSNIKRIERLLRDLKLQGRDTEFGKVLFEIFHIGRHWEFMPHPDFADENRLAAKEGKKFAFLSGFGDGVRFGMIVAAESMLVQNAALFIEEIENNHHPVSLIKTVDFLVKISRKRKLQLFLTTHSPYVWNYFLKALGSSTEIKKNLHCFGVTRNIRNGVVECKSLNPEKEPEEFTAVDKELYDWH